MKNFLLTLLSLFTALSVNAVELSYKWQSGKIYRFKAVEIDKISTKIDMSNMPGMSSFGNINMGGGEQTQEKYQTDVTFALKVNGVDAQGTATGVLYLENFKITDSKGRVLATLASVPQSAVKSAVKVDKKGHFTFLERVSMIMTETSNYLIRASGNVEGNRITASGEANGTQLNVYAEFDPKTGSLKSGYQLTEKSEPKSVKTKAKSEDPELDIIPYDFLEMLALPDGDVKAGDEASVKAGAYTEVIKVNSIANNLAEIQATISTDKNAKTSDLTKSSSQIKSGENDEEVSFDMDTNVDIESELSEMNPEEKTMMDSATKMATPEMNGTIKGKFDYAKGLYQSITGELKTKVNATGFSMNVESTLEMRML